MKKLRMICNMMVDVDRNGVISRETISFGKLFDVKYVQISDDPEFADVHLADGGIIYGINRALMEVNEIEVRDYVAPVEKPALTINEEVVNGSSEDTTSEDL